MVEVLDHGYLKLVDKWGSDEAIVEAARQSTQKGFLGWGPQHTEACASRRPAEVDRARGVAHEWRCDCGGIPGDEKLLKYLYTNVPPHSGPFEFAGLVIEVQAPIFVFREWHRHRTQSYNEMSARYAPLPDLNYVPTVERLLMSSKKNKQAGAAPGAAELTETMAATYRDALVLEYRQQENFYQNALNMGVPKELARVHLPVGRYSRMRAATCLRNWLAFLTLRMDKNAQYEIRMYANAVGALVEEHFPRTWALFKEAPHG